MGACNSLNSQKKPFKDARHDVIKKVSTLKRGETVFGKRGDQSE